MLEAICPNGHRLQVPPEHAGLKLRCPACNAIFQLIGPAIAATNAAVALPSGAQPGNPSNGESAAAIGPSVAASSPSATTNVATTPLSADAPGTRWSGTESAPMVSTGHAASTSSTTSSSKVLPPTAPVPTPAARIDWPAKVHLWIKPMLVLGLVMAITARGCDALAVKNVARLQGTLELEQRDFQADNTAATSGIENQLRPTSLPPAQRTQLQKQLDDLKTAQDKRHTELQSGEWRELKDAAERAAIEARAGAYGRELLFLAGTILFAVGLLTTSLLGEGTERWLCVSLLAIVVFSLFVGGAGWSAAFLHGGGR